MKKWSDEDLKYLKENLKKSNKELMDYFNCTREELSAKLKSIFKSQNRFSRWSKK